MTDAEKAPMVAAVAAVPAAIQVAQVVPTVMGMDRYTADGVGDQSVMWIKQQPKLLEMVTGCEAKNTYIGLRTQAHVEKPDQANAGPTGSDQTVFVHEESECCNRVCCGPGRELTLIAKDGIDKGGTEYLRMYKPMHCPGCCCMRPEFNVTGPGGTPIGKIEDPFACCTMNQKIIDASGTQIYGVNGSICQLGLCCPCLAPVVFDITDAGGAKQGEIKKVFNGCAECLAQANAFKITFPAKATTDQKNLVFAACMLVDLEYFEKKEDSGGH
eukprot:SAG22_NODE_1693_length_3799_cov_2.227568_3_plen_271_part_00